VGIVKEVPLTLPEALHLAIANNPDFQAAQAEIKIAGYRSVAASGAYVPTFQWIGSFGRQTPLFKPSTNGLNSASITNRWYRTSPSLAGSSPLYGGHYEVAFSGERWETNNSLAAVNPTYPNVVSLRYTQPLWRNLRYDAARHAIEVTLKNQQMAAAAGRQEISRIIHETEQAYWELTFARNEVAIQTAALAAVRRQEANDRRKLDEGTRSPIDITASQVHATNFEIAVYTAQEELTRAENRLKSLILGDRSADLWDSAISPASPPETNFAAPEVTRLLQEALAQRPETAQLRIAAEINQADERLRREQGKPQLDLVGTYSRTTLGDAAVSNSGSATENLNPALLNLRQLLLASGLNPVLGGYGRSLNDLLHRDVPSTEIQLRFSIPLSTRSVKAGLEESLAEGKRLAFKRRSLEQEIESEIRNALQALDSARQRLQAARARRLSAVAMYEDEQRRFDKQTSTLFLVQQRQLALVTSSSQVNRAEADLNQAISLLQFAQGTNYQRYNLAFR